MTSHLFDAWPEEQFAAASPEITAEMSAAFGPGADDEEWWALQEAEALAELRQEVRAY